MLASEIDYLFAIDYLMHMILAVVRWMVIIHKHARFSTFDDFRTVFFHVTKSVHSDKIVLIGLELRRNLRLCSVV